MQLPVGLLLLAFALLLHNVHCSTTEGPNTLEEAEALAKANAEAGSQAGDHLGDVSVNNGKETKAEVQTSDQQYDNVMEVYIQELQADVQNGDVQPTGNLADMIEHVAAEYANGTKEGEPSKFHSELEVGVDNSTSDSTNREIHNRQAFSLRSRWTDAIIPYSFSDVRNGESGVPDYGQKNITKAMKFLEATTCLKFPLWTPTVHSEYHLTHSNYLRFIVPDIGGCWSAIGQTSQTGQPISCCNQYQICLHEIGHALGLLHEQDRSDRDKFVSLHPENAEPHIAWAFSGPPYTGGLNIHPYDLTSIMHYGMYTFTYNGEKTLDVLDDANEFLFGTPYRDISHYDIMGLNYFYECTKKCPADKKALKCQNDGFVDVHCKCKCSALFTGDLCENLYMPLTVTAWPTGSWGIPDSKDGCPTTGTWATGSRTHASELESLQYSGYLKPFDRTLVVDHFCMKDNALSGSGDWPAGTYCIYQQGDSCPTGFQSGSITFDDENTRAATENTITGSLPKGVYDENTKYFYCCRDDGPAKTPITLPRDKPFHLLKYKETCQYVVDMLNTGFFVRFNQEDTSTVSASTDPHPFYKTWFSDVWLYYCYYKPISYEGCGGVINLTDANPSVNISSPNYPQNYNNLKECTWVVKAPEGKHLVLDFDDFDLEENNDKECQDSVEIRYTLIGQRGEKYCGKEFKRSVVSPAGFIALTFRTGFLGTRKGFSSTVRIVSDAEQCINTEDFGKSYRGNVDYTQHYDKCIPWEKAQHCNVNAFSEKYMYSGLVGNSKCRNPNNRLRPWCYINEYCDIDFCDVCGISRCYDFSTDCEELIAHKPNFCEKDGFKSCHKSCNLCGRGHEKLVSFCPAPVVLDKNAVIELAKAYQTSFAFGEKVKIECKQKVDNNKITSELTCTTDGKYAGMKMFCGIKCPDGWKRFRENCYKFTDTQLHYAEAITACAAENAVITGIADAEENEFVRKIVGGSAGWIGYHDMDQNDQWEWVDGVKRNYTNWRPNEPWGSSERCTIIEKDGFWNNIYCQRFYPQKSVCKKKHQEYDSGYYCVDEELNTFDIISRNYKVCKKYTPYAFAKLRRSCGICQEMICLNPGLVTNTVQKVKDLFIRAGEYFEYECSSGYELFSGNLGRTCLISGTISGIAPVCKPEAEFEDTYGYRVKPRAITELRHRLTVFDFGSNIDRDGKVVCWDVYSTIRTTIVAQVWRRHNDTFTLIGQNLLTLRAKIVNTYRLKSFEEYYVKKGDLIGFYTPSDQGIQYSLCHTNYANRAIYQTSVTNMDDVKVGMQRTLPLVARCRTYSIAVTIGAGEGMQGNPVQAREQVDSSSSKGHIYLEGSPALTVSKSGSIKSWKLYSDSDYDVTMMVLQPQSDKYILVGENTVSIRGRVTNIIDIAPFDRIQVQGGDLIAWYYLPGKDPAIPYDLCSSSTQQAKYIKHPHSEPLVVGQTLTGTTPSNPCRTYSISYMMGDEQPVFENVAALRYLSTCSGASSRQGICDMVLDEVLTDWDSSWVPDSPPTGQNFALQFSEIYTLVGGRIMQRMSASAQIKTVRLEFGDGTTKEVTLRKRQGSSDGDFLAQMWDTFLLDESVDTNSVIATITELYPQSQTDSKVGIIEFQLLANGCPLNWTRYEDNCYRKHPTTQFYHPSEAACQAWGAHVSTVKDQAENDFLVEMAENQYIYLGYTWGGSKWVASDGSALNYTNWDAGSPNEPHNYEHCIATTTNGKWNDQFCEWYYAKPVICKKGIKGLTPIVNVGAPAEPRDSVASRPRIFIPDNPDFIFNKAGRITAWRVYGSEKSIAVFSVYRRVVNEINKFIHVGSNTIETEAGRMSNIKVPEGFQINVLTGDLIGIRTPLGYSGVNVDYCNNNVVQMDTWQIKYIDSTPEPGQVLTFTSLKSINDYPCRIYSVNAFVEEVKERPTGVNIGSAGMGATCEASDNEADCGKVIDDNIVPSSEWKVTASQVTGNWIKVNFSESYLVEYISIMQRFGPAGQSKDITLEFSNSFSQKVTLKQRTGGSFTNPWNGFWDDFKIDKVDTTFIKFTINNMYTESENGFVEIRVYAGCPTNYVRYKDHCYELVKEKAKYFPAHARCVADGAKLVRVDDADENKFLQTLPGNEKIWIGYRDNYVAKPNAVWSWEGHPAYYTYTNWAPWQPAAAGTWGYCATLDTDGLWRDHYCKWYNYYWFVCEKNAPGIGGAKKRDIEMQSIDLETELETGLSQRDATPPAMAEDSEEELRDGPNDVNPPPMEGDSDPGENGATPPTIVLKPMQGKSSGRLARMIEQLNIN